MTQQWSTIADYTHGQVLEHTNLLNFRGNILHLRGASERAWVGQFTSDFTASASVAGNVFSGFELVIGINDVCRNNNRGLLMASFSARSAGSAQPFEYFFRIGATDYVAGYSNHSQYSPVNMFYSLDALLDINSAFWSGPSLTIKVGVRTLGSVVNAEIPGTSLPQIAVLEV